MSPRAIRILATFALLAPTQVPAQVTIGTPTSNNCIPFGCTDGGSRYQQVYNGSAFGGPLTFNAMSIFGGTMSAGSTYDIYFSTTPKAAGDLSTHFDDNIGTQLTLFAHFVNLVNVPTHSVITIFGYSYAFDPALGNLLMEVRHASIAGGAFDAGDDPNVQRVVGSGADGATDLLNGQVRTYGLVTRFEPDPTANVEVTATPEPATLLLVATGLLCMLAIGRRGQV